MRVFQMTDGWGIDALKPAERPEPTPGSGEVAVAIEAASLNYRDLLTVNGKGSAKPTLPLVPFSDGAGKVVAVGAGVSRVALGDLVCPMFFQGWVDGPPTAEKRASPLGGPLDGVLQPVIVLNAEGVSRAPAQFSPLEAATLPCAGLTAWRAVVEEGAIGAGDTVLVEGTGGVSIFALQFAKMRGATVIVTSSSDDKLARARELGADHLINYMTTDRWDKEVLSITGGRGVDLVVEVGGQGTINKAITACRVGGRIVVIGVLSGFAETIALPSLFSKNLTMTGISVGSRAQFEAMTAAIEAAGMHPVIDQVFPVEEVGQALRHMESQTHFGKLCLAF